MTPIIMEDLPVRIYNALRHEGITCKEELAERTTAELLRIPNFGRKSLDLLRSTGLDWDRSHDGNTKGRRYTCAEPGCQVSPFSSTGYRDSTRCAKHQPKKDWVDGPLTMLRDAAEGKNIKARARAYLEKKGKSWL